MNNNFSLTSISLLEQLRSDSDNEAAWRVFVERYGPQVLAWCRVGKLQQSDAEDVTQTVLLKLAGTMKEFEYDPSMSFQAWLYTVTQRTVTDFFRQRENKAVVIGGSNAARQFESVEAREDLLHRLRETFDLEIFDAAKELVRQRVTPQRWQAYKFTAIEGRGAREVARQLEMKVATVYTAKNKIQIMLQQEVERLQEAPISTVFRMRDRP